MTKTKRDHPSPSDLLIAERAVETVPTMGGIMLRVRGVVVGTYDVETASLLASALRAGIVEMLEEAAQPRRLTDKLLANAIYGKLAASGADGLRFIDARSAYPKPPRCYECGGPREGDASQLRCALCRREASAIAAGEPEKTGG